MPIRQQNKINPNFNMSSLTDIIFLLLIFFLLTSTLVSPNAIKLVLPSSNSQTLQAQTVSVSITKKEEYFIDLKQVDFEEIEPLLVEKIKEDEDATIVLYAEKTVPFDAVVGVMDIAKNIDAQLIVATQPKR